MIEELLSSCSLLLAPPDPLSPPDPLNPPEPFDPPEPPNPPDEGAADVLCEESGVGVGLCVGVGLGVGVGVGVGLGVGFGVGVGVGVGVGFGVGVGVGFAAEEDVLLFGFSSGTDFSDWVGFFDALDEEDAFENSLDASSDSVLSEVELEFSRSDRKSEALHPVSKAGRPSSKLAESKTASRASVFFFLYAA